MNAVMLPAAVALGATTVTGLVLLLAGLRQRRRGSGEARSRPRLVSGLPRAWRWPRLLGAVFAAVAVGGLTGWPVAGCLAGVGVMTLPALLGPDREAAHRVERMEAVATWTEMLRDTLSAAAGLEQALLATAEVAPPALRAHVRALAGRIRAGRPLPEALEHFAREVDDPVADTVVTVLHMAASRQAAQLAPLLGSLADAVREQVAMRQRIAAGRTSVRTSTRVCCATTLTLAAGLVVFNRPYLEPFDGPSGQLALAAVGLLFAASFTWLHTIAAVREAPRLLARDQPARSPRAEGVVPS